jgi:lysophospholipase L1-like esterase
MTARGRLLSGLVATVIALAGFVTVGAPTAAAGPSGPLPYVALGDSYAAGTGAPPYQSVSVGDKTCDQSINSGYPVLLDPKGRIDLQANDTCPGATITDVQTNLPSERDDTIRLVTLTVGGNDLGFGALGFACLPPTGSPESPACQAAIMTAFELLPKSCNGDSDLEDLLTGLYAAVRAAYPNALIVVTGYPLLFELVPPDLATKTQINTATTLLNCAIRNAVDAAADPNIVYVDVTDAFAGHGIGALDDPFINAPGPKPSVEDFHPNAAGYRAYAKAISAAIRAASDGQKQVA